MTRAAVTRLLVLIYLVGAAARLVAWRLSPAIHPDEIFQVLEPAWWRLTGFGLSAWEWRDGVRSWVLPGYNGAWIAALMAMGVRRGATLGDFLQLHWALVNLLLVAAAYRGGAYVTRRLDRASAPADLAPAPNRPARGWQGGLIAAALVALFPLLIKYAPHTLSEMPSMLALVFGLVLTAEIVERDPSARVRTLALAAGALLSLGVCVRIVNAPVVLVAPLWLLAARRFRGLGWLVAGAVPPVLLFGLVDLSTWGHFLGSFVGYIKFNLIEGRAANFGTSPWWWYAERLFDRAPFGLPLLLLPVLLGLRANAPFTLSALLPLLALSTQAHKEERFIVLVWPYLLIAAGGAAGAWLARPAPHARLRRVQIGVLAGALVVLGDAAAHVRGPPEHTFAREWFEGQAAAGDDPLCTGLMLESVLFTGGSTWFGRPVLQRHFDPELLPNPIISHVLVRTGWDNDRRARAAGFVPIFARGDVILLRRGPK